MATFADKEALRWARVDLSDAESSLNWAVSVREHHRQQMMQRHQAVLRYEERRDKLADEVARLEALCGESK